MINWTNKKVLVAGGAGQIGSHLSKRLVSLGAEVTVADNLSSGSTKNILGTIECMRFYKTDLRDSKEVDYLVSDSDYVFQLAANMGGMIYIDQNAKHNVEIMRDNVLINLNMLEAARKYDIAGLFYSSSACVYPTFLQKETNAKSINLKESDAIPADPNEFYGWEKLFTEKLCEAYQNDYDTNIRIARFHNVYGECYTSFNKDRGKAPCLLIANVLRYNGGDFTGIWGSGEQVRSFLYAEDCVDGILALMNSDYNKPINIGSDKSVTINQLADLIFKIAGKKPDNIVRQMNMPIGVMGRNASLDLVRKEIGWEPKVSLEDGLTKVYRWAESHFDELINA